VSFDELRDRMLAEYDVLVGAVRVSVGIATNFADIYRLMVFMQRFVNRSSTASPATAPSCALRCSTGTRSAPPPA
jgi:hypothetical protein